MKKLTALLALFAAGMFACGGGDSDSGNNDAVPPIAGIVLEGNTWKLTYDLDLTEPLTVPDGISINLNGHTITGQDKITVEISSPSGFESFRQMLSPGLNGINAELLNDIDMKGAELEALSAENLFAMYSGTINGNNHVIKNIGNIKPIYEPNYEKNVYYVTLFPVLNGSTVKNLSFEDMNINIEIIKEDSVIIICPIWCQNSTIYNISRSGTTVAEAKDSAVGVEFDVSGLFFCDDNSQISNCFHNGSITVENTKSANVAGIIWAINSDNKISDNKINNCYHSGEISFSFVSKKTSADGIYCNKQAINLTNFFSTGTNICAATGCSSLSNIYSINSSDWTINYVQGTDEPSDRYPEGSALVDALNDWVDKNNDPNDPEYPKYRFWKSDTESDPAGRPVFK